MASRRATTPAPLVWLQPAPAGRPRDLRRETIVDAAIAVADEGGAPALTMAAVARCAGGYTPMALYRHVPGKDGLIDLMLDQVTGEIVLPHDQDLDWRATLTAVARATWDMVVRHPWYAELVHTRPPLGPNAMHRTERLLDILTHRGATLTEAMSYAAVLDVHVVGSARQAAEERTTHRRYGVTNAASLAAAISGMRELAVADGNVPLLATWMAAPEAVSPEAQFELSLGFLLDGIASRLPSPRRRARA